MASRHLGSNMADDWVFGSQRVGMGCVVADELESVMWGGYGERPSRFMLLA
ncbi:unnamed protein product [Dovyalis caffra]|uniref:Uncharacterized protein n=1 Tax=Dovyalis caffra TaxID=77055 RepID=A0AAV1ST52_9ROSI|nr:unnamed protein product [Dovyalis caffra]